MPGHEPAAFVIVQFSGGLGATPSSMMKLQLLSVPSHVSVAGVLAVHAVHPVNASHIWVPKQVPIAFVSEQLRIAPTISSVHVQLPVTGWQKSPVCPPLASGLHV